MAPMANSLAIYGYASRAADLALRRVLKFRDCHGQVIIIDYRGRGAAVLDKTNMQNLNHRPVSWYDLADRLHPILALSSRALGTFPHFDAGLAEKTKNHKASTDR